MMCLAFDVYVDVSQLLAVKNISETEVKVIYRDQSYEVIRCKSIEEKAKLLWKIERLIKASF